MTTLAEVSALAGRLVLVEITGPYAAKCNAIETVFSGSSNRLYVQIDSVPKLAYK